MERALKAAKFPNWQIGGLIEDYTVKEITGNDVISFEQFADDYKNAFA